MIERPLAGSRWRALVLGWVLATAPGIACADWPNWRGPAYDGRVAPGVLDAGDFTLEVAWKRPLGIGYSGVSVADGLAVTMYSDGTREFLVALDVKTGETVWSYDIAPFFPDDGGGSDGGAKSAPSIDDGVGGPGCCQTISAICASKSCCICSRSESGARARTKALSTAARYLSAD